MQTQSFDPLSEHPLYADSAAIQQREIELERIQNLSNEDIDSDYEEADEELLEDILQAKSSNSKLSQLSKHRLLDPIYVYMQYHIWPSVHFSLYARGIVTPAHTLA